MENERGNYAEIEWDLQQLKDSTYDPWCAKEVPFPKTAVIFVLLGRKNVVLRKNIRAFLYPPGFCQEQEDDPGIPETMLAGDS